MRLILKYSLSINSYSYVFIPLYNTDLRIAGISGVYISRYRHTCASITLYRIEGRVSRQIVELMNGVFINSTDEWQVV